MPLRSFCAPLPSAAAAPPLWVCLALIVDGHVHPQPVVDDTHNTVQNPPPGTHPPWGISIGLSPPPDHGVTRREGCG